MPNSKNDNHLCSHVTQIKEATPRTSGCEECMRKGDPWVYLRVCVECGHVGCCDASKGKHATKHFHQTRHPVIRSLEPGETWGWCYQDEVMLEFETPLREFEKFPNMH